jgi:glycine cleavage system regulatory protein
MHFEYQQETPEMLTSLMNTLRTNAATPDVEVRMVRTLNRPPDHIHPYTVRLVIGVNT